jgi:heme-degrading monooxygenase HmoA
MEIHEFISSKFQADCSHEEQKRILDGLGAAVSAQPGFVSRELFYSEADERWLAHIIWEDEAAVERSEAMERDPEVSKLYEGFDVEAMMYGRYRLS